MLHAISLLTFPSVQRMNAIGSTAKACKFQQWAEGFHDHRRAFTSNPAMSSEKIRRYFSDSPRGAQLLMDYQRQVAQIYGPQGVGFQDWLAVKVGKVDRYYI